MTITLAAVYVPIAFQGGLTGSLFREFALTLAGAVTISGVVALTLSPMMSAYLLTPGEDEGPRRAHQPWLRRAAQRVRARARIRPAPPRHRLHRLGRAHICSAVLMFMQSPKELAPAEDQGVIFGIINTPANSTLDQLEVSTTEVNRTLMEIPETEFTFQITNPGGGFWGVGSEALGRAEAHCGADPPEVQRQVGVIPGIQTFAVLPPALPGGGTFPVEFVIASTAEASEILGIRHQLQEKATASGKFYFPPHHRREDRPAAVRDRSSTARRSPSLASTCKGRSGLWAQRSAGTSSTASASPAGATRSSHSSPRTERLNPDQLNDIYVTGPSGRTGEALLHRAQSGKRLRRVR